MSTFRTPVGPQPSRVYWRRRLVLLLGVLVVILIVVLIVVRPGGSGKPAGLKTSAPPTTAAVGACKPAALDVEAAMDAASYAPGVDPKLSLTIENTGATACTFGVGSDVQDYEITSGTEKIWSSKDCQTSPEPVTATLKPGVPVQSTPFAWDRTRSDPSTCKSTHRHQVTAKGASYHLTVTVNGIKSKNNIQFVLR